MNNLTKYLQGGDLRLISEVEQVIELVNTQFDFDQLFRHLYSSDRLIVIKCPTIQTKRNKKIEKIIGKYSFSQKQLYCVFRFY